MLTLREVYLPEEPDEKNEDIGGPQQYPPTASEYASQLNSKGGRNLETDQNHWSENGIHTGEDLARYFAVQDHWNTYRDMYGMKPKHMDYDNMSIDEIKLMTDNLVDMEYEDRESPYESPHTIERGENMMKDLEEWERENPTPEDGKFSMNDEEYMSPEDIERERDMWEQEMDSYAGGGRGFDF